MRVFSFVLAFILVAIPAAAAAPTINAVPVCALPTASGSGNDTAPQCVNEFAQIRALQDQATGTLSLCALTSLL